MCRRRGSVSQETSKMPNDIEYNFTGGMPDPQSFPIEGLINAAATALRRVGGDRFVRYPGDHGDVELREVIAHRFTKSQGSSVQPSDVAITTGSMQGIDLLCRAFVRPGDTVIVEELTYMGALGALRHFGADLVGVPVDEHGMDVDALERTLHSLRTRGIKPAFIYTIPVNQNPTGAHLSADRKARLLELTEEFDVLVVEDECYADIYFESSPPRAMFRVAKPRRVLYLGSFSKVIGPGMRLGYMIASPTLLSRLLMERWDSGTSAFASVILAEYLRDNMWRHIEDTNTIVQEKRDILMAALDAALGDSLTCRTPKGGLFAWVGLPKSTDMDTLMDALAKRKVICTRGRDFRYDSLDIPFVRFSYGFPSHQIIRDGIKIFAECVRAAQPAEHAALLQA